MRKIVFLKSYRQAYQWNKPPWNQHPGVRQTLTVGEKAADRMKSILATWTALILVSVYIVCWMVFNSHLVGKGHFDPFPWILLNLTLSAFAALQCFVLLIANRRGEQIAAETALYTAKMTEEIKEQNDTLVQLLKANNELTEDIDKLSHDLHEHLMEA